MATAPTGARRRLTKPARRATLISAAEALFGEVGYSGATMELIAARAGVTRSLVYEHFASIDALYLECHRAAREEMEQRLFAAAAEAGASLEDQLRAGLGAYFSYFADQPQRFGLLYGAGGPGGTLAEKTAELRFVSAERIAAMFIAAAPQAAEDETVAAAHIVSGASEQLARWSRRNPNVSTETLVEWMMLAIWPGMQKRLDDAAAGLL